MGPKLRHMARGILRYSPLGISLFSLIVSGAALWNTMYQQDREFGRNEMLIRPYLTFVVNFDRPAENVYGASFGIRNDGLGPAVIRDLIVQTDSGCISSAGYATSPNDWDVFYRDHVIPRLEKLSIDAVNAQISSDREKNADSFVLSDVSKGEAFRKKKPTKQVRKKVIKDGAYTSYETSEVYGIETVKFKLGAGSLAPGQIITVGSTVRLIDVNAEVSFDIAKSEQMNKKPVTAASPAPTPPQSGVNKQLLEEVTMWVGYCSLSGGCDSISIGDRKCLEQAGLQSLLD
jgi:hypothetical protein